MYIKEKNNFDFLRYILAFIVVLVHIGILAQSKELWPFLKYFDAEIAVSGFFIISGFLITKSYITTNNFSHYLQKRARRLLPGYILVIIICALVLSLISSKNLISYFSDNTLIKYILYNLIFQNYFQHCLPGVFENNYMCAVNGALWTIKIEVFFYLILPLLIYFINKLNKKKYVFFIIIYILSLIYRYFLSYYFHLTGNRIFDILEHQLPGFMSYFVMGIAFQYYYDYLVSKLKYLILLAVPLYILESYFHVKFLEPITLSIIIFYVAFNFQFLNNYGKYGDFSYGVYIYHFPLIQLFTFFNLFNDYNPWAVFILLLITINFVAYLSWHFLEAKFLKKNVKYPLFK